MMGATSREVEPNLGGRAANSNFELSISNALPRIIYGYEPCLMFSRCSLVAKNKVGLQEALNHTLYIRMLNVSEEM